MPDLKAWQSKIQDKRKKTNFRDFLMDFSSCLPVVFHRNNNLISRYHKNSFINICSREEFEKGRDNLMKQTGRVYDTQLPFFEQLKSLWSDIKMPNMIHSGVVENADFSDTIVNAQNAYLSNIVTVDCENILYSTRVSLSSDISNSLFIVSSQELSFTHQVHSSYKVFYSRFIHNCNNIWLSTNLTGCSECIWCYDLQNANYYIENKKYSKTDYHIKKTEILRKKEDFLARYTWLGVVWKNIASSDVSGTSIFESENIENGNFIFQTKNGRNLFYVWWDEPLENCYDFFSGWGWWGNDYYGAVMSGISSHIYCSTLVGYSNNIFYSYYLTHCSYCFACIGLANKQYCIFNKQYTKEQWHKMADKIFSSMESEWSLWDFFPWDLNPFYFNDTMAGLLWDFTKQEVEAKWYMWRDEEIKVDIPEGSKVIQTTELTNYQWYDADNNWKIDPEILGVVIQDEKWNYYRIVQMEYDFLMKHELPLPEIHWMDRMKLNFGVS